MNGMDGYGGFAVSSRERDPLSPLNPVLWWQSESHPTANVHLLPTPVVQHYAHQLFSAIPMHIWQPATAKITYALQTVLLVKLTT